jgi:hypothetical protein
MNCIECSKTIMFRYNEDMNEQLRTTSLCFNCHFWTEKLNYRGDHAVVRANGVHYMYDTKKPWNTDTNKFRGYGGAIFEIRYFLADENQPPVTTNDLWCQGDIPEHFRSRLPDNATITRKVRPEIERFRELMLSAREAGLNIHTPAQQS